MKTGYFQVSHHDRWLTTTDENGLFSGQVVGGTRVFEDKVFFESGGGYVEAPIIVKDPNTNQFISSGGTLVVNVPPNASTGNIHIQTPMPNQIIVDSPKPFTVLGVPTLTRIEPNEAQSGGLLQVVGSNFSSTDIVVRVAFDGQPLTPPFDVRSEGVITLSMPGEVPEGGQATVTVETRAGVSNGVTVKRLPGRAPGSTLFPELSSEMKSDGILSLAEAVDIVQGKIVDPFAKPWDDTDQDMVIKATDIYKWVPQDLNGDGTIDPEEGYWSYVRTDYALESQTPRDNRGHEGNEIAFVTLKRFEMKDQEKSLGEQQINFSLDNPSAKDIFGFTVEGMGKAEEGDANGLTANVGKDTADTVRVLGGGDLTMDITLDVAGSGGDTIVWEKFVNLTGNVVIATDDNQMRGGRSTPWVQISGKIVITGNRNRLDDVKSTGGLVIQGGSSNDVGSGSVVLVDGAGTGVEIKAGAKLNIVTATVVNCGTGVKVSGNGTLINMVKGAIGRGTDGNPGPNGVGVEISEGAAWNGVEADVQYNKGDGIVITGAGTDNNFVRDASWNDGNGVHIKDGASNNVVRNSFKNKGHGVLIEGNGTDGNTVKGGQHTFNQKAGVAVVGQPLGTVISGVGSGKASETFIYGNGVAQALLQNLQASGAPSVTVRKCELGQGGGGGMPGIVLENVSGALIEKNRYWDLSDGLQMKGAGTNNNTVRNEEFTNCQKLAHITNQASANVIQSILFNYGSDPKQPLILLEGGASNNKISGLTVRLFGGPNPPRPGVVMQGGTSNNLLEGARLLGVADSLIIQGSGTTGNTVEDSSLTNAIVRGGATNTTIGSLIEGRGNYIGATAFLGSPSLLIQGAATKGVRVWGNYIDNGSPNILVEDAQDIDIGSAQGAGGNEIAESLVDNVVLFNAKNVVIANNDIVNSGLSAWGAGVSSDGVVVSGGSTNITIGGQSPADGNRVSFFNQRGVQVVGSEPQNVQILNNTFNNNNGIGVWLAAGVQGVLVSNNVVIESTDKGILIDGMGTSQNTITGNFISQNAGDAINIAGAAMNSIRGNSIFNNGGKGINLNLTTAPGNGGIPAPTFTGFVPANQLVSGTVPLSVPVGSTVEIFGDADDEGQVLLGVAPVRPGHDFLIRLGTPLPPGMNLTATVTDPQGNTSEFSNKFRPSGARPPFIVFTSTSLGNREIHRLFAGEAASTRLTDNPAADHSPALSPDFQKVAFVSERLGNPDIWGMNSDGTYPYPLTRNAASDFDPAWSPDGKKIVFVSNRDGNNEIFLMDADGELLGNPQQLTQTDNTVTNFHPTWSPDGTRIAFVSNRSSSLDLFVMNADGSNPVNVSNSPAADDQPAWSPDGQDIAFVSNRDGNPKIYLMKSDGSNVRRLTNGGGVDVNPAWTAGGEIMFSSNREDEFELFVMNSDGSLVRRLTLSLGINVQPNAGRQ